MAKNALNAKVAKKAYTTTATHLAKLEQDMNSLAKHVTEMNKEVWYGGKKATAWYKYVDTVYKNLVTFHGGVTNFQNSIHSVFAKGGNLTGIEF